MGSGVSGLYSGAVPGDADYMPKTDDFSRYISNRKDIDPNGFYDIIAHGTPKTIEIMHNGVKVQIDHRSAARLFAADKNYKGQKIRLLSCSTGKISNGFAQGLADKLHVIVEAPTDILWAEPSGKHYVSGKDGRGNPDRRKPGSFRIFEPGGYKKWKK